MGSVTKIFDRVAKGYDARQLQRMLYRPGHDAVLDVLHRVQPQRVADVACGTGILAARIEAELHPEEVHGFDLSTGMLAKARERSAAVRWTVASAMQLPLDDGAVDAVTCTAAYPFFDQPAALAEFRRVLAPGGRAIVTVYTTPIQLLSRLSGAVAGRVLGAGRWPTKLEVAGQFAAAGFDSIVQHRIPRPGPLARVPEYITIGSRPGWR